MLLLLVLLLLLEVVMSSCRCCFRISGVILVVNAGYAGYAGFLGFLFRLQHVAAFSAQLLNTLS